MQRFNHLYEQIQSRDNLQWAFYRSLRGKRGQSDARAFAANLELNLRHLSSELAAGSIRVGDFTQFTIHDPKERLITAPCFRERVLHHAIMNVCEPIFERALIADTFACRVGKGRLAALARARYFAFDRPFFLKLDIRKYFDSVPHDRLLRRLDRLFKDVRLMRLLERIIGAYAVTPARGLPIGSLTSQHFANFYLGALDRFVKESLRVRGYVRYMDDFALWGECSRELRQQETSITGFLEMELGLSAKPPFINRTRLGMDWLGCRVFPDHLTLNRRSRRRFARKLRRYDANFAAGQWDDLTFQQRVGSLVAFTRTPGVKSWNFRQSVLAGLSWPD